MTVCRAALLVDLVASRRGDRQQFQQQVSRSARHTNERISAVEALRPTVGDEWQGIYATLGDALAASFTLRLALSPNWQVRFGIGIGEVTVIDEARDIQDGSAWWLAREAIEWVEAQAKRRGYGSARTAVKDIRPTTLPVQPICALIDAQLAQLRTGAHHTLGGLWEGLDNAAIAAREGISESANSQRVTGNGLRPLVEAMQALAQLN